MTDRLTLTHALEGSGMQSEAAERIASEIYDAIHNSVATKTDLRELELRLDGRFKAVDIKFEQLERRIDQVVVRLGAPRRYRRRATLRRAAALAGALKWSHERPLRHGCPGGPSSSFELLRRLAAGEQVKHQIDWKNIVDEVESVGLEQLRAVESLLTQALAHMAKAEAWSSGRDVPHWHAEARRFRGDAAARFAPSMRQRLDLEKSIAGRCGTSRDDRRPATLAVTGADLSGDARRAAQRGRLAQCWFSHLRKPDVGLHLRRCFENVPAPAEGVSKRCETARTERPASRCRNVPITTRLPAPYF
jgi:hypothetical protein